MIVEFIETIMQLFTLIIVIYGILCWMPFCKDDVRYFNKKIKEAVKKFIAHLS